MLDRRKAERRRFWVTVIQSLLSFALLLVLLAGPPSNDVERAFSLAEKLLLHLGSLR